MCGCSGSISNCNCSCETITLEQIAGPTGATGPAGTTVLYSMLGSTLTSATTGMDAILATSPTTAMPNGTRLPAAQLDTNGDFLDIYITGAVVGGGAANSLKVDFGNPTQTLFNLPGVLVNENYYCHLRIIRINATTAKAYCTTFYNESSVLYKALNNYTCDFTAAIDIEFYVNQSVADSIEVDSILITQSAK